MNLNSISRVPPVFLSVKTRIESVKPFPEINDYRLKSQYKKRKNILKKELHSLNFFDQYA